MVIETKTIPGLDDWRVTLSADVDADNPRTWGPITGALTVAAPRNTIDVEPVHEFPGLTSSLEAAASYGSFAFVERWARIFWDVTVVNDREKGTVWWADPDEMRLNWPDLVQGTPEYVERERIVIAQDIRTYHQWANGDVYGITIERFDEALDGFVDVESCWGYYFDNDGTDDEVFAAASELNADFADAFSALNEKQGASA